MAKIIGKGEHFESIEQMRCINITKIPCAACGSLSTSFEKSFINNEDNEYLLFYCESCNCYSGYARENFDY